MAETDYHVVWKDRVGLFDEWKRLITECNMAYGSPEYPGAVQCLRINIINIKGEKSPKLRDDVNSFDKKLIERISNARLRDNIDPSFYRYDDIETEQRRSEILFQYMIQLLEDNGFISYKAGYEGEYDKWE